MKLVLASFVALVSMSGYADGTYYNGVPTVSFTQSTKGLGESEINLLISKCKSELKSEEQKLVNAGAVIVKSTACAESEPSIPSAGKYVSGNLMFIK